MAQRRGTATNRGTRLYRTKIDRAAERKRRREHTVSHPAVEVVETPVNRATSSIDVPVRHLVDPDESLRMAAGLVEKSQEHASILVLLLLSLSAQLSASHAEVAVVRAQLQSSELRAAKLTRNLSRKQATLKTVRADLSQLNRVVDEFVDGVANLV